MRILAGRFKNRVLKTPKQNKTRPTSSKIRGSVFDRLQNQIEETNFLDLFAGSGAMGIEALSRGAKFSTFVEQDKTAARCIRENLAMYNLEKESSLMQTDALHALKTLAKQEHLFNIIYIDPPYALPIDPYLEEIPNILAPDGLVILEQGKQHEHPVSTLKQIDQRKFGDTILFFYQK